MRVGKMSDTHTHTHSHYTGRFAWRATLLSGAYVNVFEIFYIRINQNNIHYS